MIDLSKNALLLRLYKNIKTPLLCILFVFFIQIAYLVLDGIFKLNIQIFNLNLEFILNIFFKLTWTLLITWLVLSTLESAKYILLTSYAKKTKDSFKYRKIHTQISVLNKILFIIIIIIATIVLLMSFDKLRVLGGSLLASAGVIAAVTTLAANKTIGNIFLGFQIALTQPIRLNDVVVIENELGTIEDINLTHVVVKLWDLRSLIVPVSYFIEKPFQNWTVNAENLIGAIYLYLDYSIPIEKIRIKFNEIISSSAIWDKKTAVLQVSDAKANVIEIRLLVSAETASNLWDLRCEVREKIIIFIQSFLPDSLPKVRIIQEQSKNH
jgi:small-conductance mechanosensitive channel